MSFQKKSNILILLSGIFSLLIFVFTTILLVLILNYQFNFLISNNFKPLANNIEPVDPVAYNFAANYIATNGLAAYFGVSFGGVVYWDLILLFFVLLMVFLVCNLFTSITVLYFGIKTNNANFIKISIFCLFCSILGSYSAFGYWRNNKNLIHENSETRLNNKLLQLETSLKEKLFLNAGE